MTKPLTALQTIGWLIIAAAVFAFVFSGGLAPTPQPETARTPAVDRDGNRISVEKYEAWRREDRERRRLCRAEGHSQLVCSMASRNYERERLNL